MQRIITLYNVNRKSFPARVDSGTDTTLACIDIVFLDWHQMYAPIVQMIDVSDGSTYEQFMNDEKLANQDLNQTFDNARPGLSTAIRENLREARVKGVIPMPKALGYENIEENAYTQNFSYCRSSALLDAVSAVVPLGTTDRGWFSSLFHRSSMRQDGSVPVRLLNKAIFIEEYQQRVNKIQQ